MPVSAASREMRLRAARILMQTIVLIVFANSTVSCTTSGGSSPPAQGALLSAEDAQFLEGLAEAVLDAARVQVSVTTADGQSSPTEQTFIRPSGGDGYPAFWIRNVAMSVDSGLITLEEQRYALMLTALHQQDGTMLLPNGARVPVGAIPDHITFRGVPIFFPGTLDDYAGQGGGSWGNYPCFDNPYFFIHMAYSFVQQTGDAAILNTNVRKKTLLKRLQLAYSMPPHDPESGLVSCTDVTRGANFGFVDTVEQTGDLLISSVLKQRAALQLAKLMEATGNSLAAELYREDAAHIRDGIATSFPLDSGLFRASTGRSAQPDVWGTALAVYLQTLPSDLEISASTALADAYRSGTIAWNGLIRHVPTDADFSGDTMWESTPTEKNRHQNGAYWATPTGWVVNAIARVNPGLSQKLAGEYIATLREGDFRKGKHQGEPWECAHPKGNYQANKAFITSVTAPLSSLRSIP